MAPSTVDLDVLLGVLDDLDVTVQSTSDLGAGAALAQVGLDQIDCGIAVVPSGHADRAAGLPAVYVEIGITIGRGLPLLVIVQPPEPPSPALAGLTTVSTVIDNAQALRLHFRLFLRSVRATPRRPAPEPVVMPTGMIPAAYRARLDAVRSAPPALRDFSLEGLVGDLLRDAGAIVEDREATGPDDGIDIVAVVPGQEHSLGTIVVEVKYRRLTSRDFRVTQERLSEYVLRSRSGLGLLVYNEAAIGARESTSTPMVFSLSIDELLTQLEHHPLSNVLAKARNRAVHGM